MLDPSGCHGFADLFADHRPQPYVTIVREIRALTPDVTIVGAVAVRCSSSKRHPLRSTDEPLRVRS